MMPGEVSSIESNFFVDALAPFVVPVPFSLSELIVLVRKAAHMSEYALLAILAIRAFIPDHTQLLALSLIATPIIDETIQLFSFGRAGLISDVFIDYGGACIGALLLFAYRRLRR